ncbi:MAG: hypothetical protein K2G77_06495 [Muribaculaceae bacterium]|nr:hypothetical protein [Muribaculaceae bacterium]
MVTIKLKKSIQSIFIGMIAMTSFPLMASSDISARGNGDAILTTKEEDPLRKRMPSRNIMQLIYFDGMLTLTSDYFEGVFSLSFVNYETDDTYEVPSIQVGQSAPLELEYGEYQVNAIGEDGSHLSGFMEVY